MKLRQGDWRTARSCVLPLRIAVFVEEQGIPLELEEDQDDPVSLHAWVEADDGQVLATGRLLPDGHIGRIAVDRGRRGEGLGARVLAHLITMAKERGIEMLALHAQTSALRFYERFGFVPRGDVFMEVGIPHQLMVRSTEESIR